MCDYALPCNQMASLHWIGLSQRQDLMIQIVFFPNFVSTYLLLTEANYRMALDDNHDSVVLSCAKVINVMLSFEFNESYFESSEVTLFLFLFESISITGSSLILSFCQSSAAESSRSGERHLHSSCVS